MKWGTSSLAALAVVALTIGLTGCAAPHDLSIAESCKQWNTLNKQKENSPESNKIVDEDLRSAEPRMNEAVARQVRAYIGYDRTAVPIADPVIEATIRLADICGFK